jgi:urease accessory protein
MTTATTITGILMPIDPRLLTLTQWLSPSYPMGAFAFSHGLEAAIAEGWVKDEDSLREWLTGVLREGSGRSDAILIWDAYRADDIHALNAIALAFAPSSERIREAERQGAAFARVTRDVWEIDLPDLLLPVALGYAARLTNLAPDALIALYLQSFVSNLTQATQRLMPLGQTSAQRVLHDLTPLCGEIAEVTRGLSHEDIHSNAFLSDIAAMRHEVQEPRLFQS